MYLIGMDIESSPSRDTMDIAAIKVYTPCTLSAGIGRRIVSLSICMPSSLYMYPE